MSFWECLVETKSFTKVRRLYMKRWKMKDRDWYDIWPTWLADEVERCAEHWSLGRRR